MAGTANIGKYGGIIEVTALTSTESNNMTGATNQPWLSIYETGDTLLAYATSNTNANSREASLSATVSTVSTASYPVVTTINCAWTVTQAGTGSSADKSILVRIEYTGNSSSVGFPVISIYSPQSTSGTRDWTPGFIGDYTELSLNVPGSYTNATIVANAIDLVPPYLTTLDMLLQGMNESATNNGDASQGVEVAINFDFLGADVGNFWLRVAGYE